MTPYASALDTIRVYGPPGTGKTHAATSWLEKQVAAGARRDALAFVSFTNAACDEARRRIGARLDLYEYELGHCATLHALAKRALNISGRDWLVDGAWLKSFASTHGYSLVASRKSTGEDLDELVKAGGEDALLLSVWDFGRARCITDPEHAYLAFEAYDPDACARIDYGKYLELVSTYEREKKNTWPRRFDYTDLLLELLAHPVSLDVDVCVVDEAQDMTPLLWRVADVLFGDTPRRASMADDDQAIFSYQGADPSLFNSRRAERVFQLEQSRRLPRLIVERALSIINQNRNRMIKHIQPVTREIVEQRSGRAAEAVELEGEVHQVSGLSDLDLHNGESWMVLVRNWAFVPAITERLENEGVPYRVQGEAHYSPWSGRGPLKAAQAMYAVSEAGGSIDTEQLETLVEKTRVETKEKPGAWKYGSKARIREWCEANPAARLSLMDLPHLGLTEWGFDCLVKRDFELLNGSVSARDFNAFTAAQERGTFGKEPQVIVSTVHGVKGAESDNCAVVMACTNAPARNLGKPDRLEEERRLSYVGLTRARKRFYGVSGDWLPFGNPWNLFGV